MTVAVSQENLIYKNEHKGHGGLTLTYPLRVFLLSSSLRCALLARIPLGFVGV